MKPVKGIFRDSSGLDQPDDTYRYAKNLLFNEYLGGIVNERGFLDVLDLSTWDCVLGALAIGQDVYIFGVDGTGDGIISRVFPDSGQPSGYDSEVTISGADINGGLGFQCGCPIQAEYYINNQGEIVIGLTDCCSPPLLINLTEVSAAPANTVDYEDLLMFPRVSEGGLAPPVVDVADGGSLLSGAYFVLYRYENIDGTNTQYSLSGGAAYISPEDDEGGDGGIVTSKAIDCTALDVDTNYDFIRFAVIYINNGIVSAGSYVRTAVAPGNVTFTITNNNYFEDFGDNITPLIAPRPPVQTACAITQLGGSLYLGDIVYEDAIDYQLQAMDIELEWIASPVLKSESRDAALNTTLMPGEVYAFYIVFNLKTGGLSKAFHIPGRPSVASDLTSAPSVPGAPTGQRTFQYRSTVQNVTYNAGNDEYVGDFGYWENKDENYPNDAALYGSSAGNPVRHHRAPDDLWFTNQTIGGNPNINSDYIAQMGYRIGIKTKNVNIPAGLEDKVTGFTILYARRTIADTYHRGRGIISPFFQPSAATPDQDLKPTSGPFQTLAQPNQSSADSGQLVTQKVSVKINHLSLLISEPAINVDTLGLMCGLDVDETDGFGPCKARYDNELPVDIPTFPPGWEGLDDNYRYNFMEFTEHNQLNKPSDWREVEDQAYLRTGVKYSNPAGETIANTHGEDCYYMHLDGLAMTSAQIVFNQGHNPVYGVTYNWLQNVYSSFLSQELLLFTNRLKTGKGTVNSNGLNNGWIQVTASGIQTSYEGFGGDGSINLYRYQSTGPVNGDFGAISDNGIQNEGSGSKTVFEHMEYNTVNHFYRHEDRSDGQSLFAGPSSNYNILGPPDGGNTWPESVSVAARDAVDAWFFREMNMAASMNYLYNRDYLEQNRYIATFIENPGLEDATVFPYTLIWSTIRNVESPFISWKDFPINNRYSLPGNKGPITNLEGAGNQQLYIHMRDTLYITKTTTTLQGTQDVTLGSSDIFSVPPYEVVTVDEGYAGTQNPFGCLMTPHGYFFVDNQKGRIYLHNGQQLDDLSGRGLRRFFRDKLDVRYAQANNRDNPFAQDGISTVYDYNNERLIVSFNSTTDQNFTMSYSPMMKMWVSFHDYQMNGAVVTTDKANFSFGINKDLHIHDKGDYGNYYGTVNPAFIDVVTQYDKQSSDYLQAIMWSETTSDPVTFEVFNNDTFNHITVWNARKTSGRVATVLYQNLQNPGNLRKKEGNWWFNNFKNLYNGNVPILRDLANDYTPDPLAVNNALSWFQKERMNDKAFFVRMEYDNAEGDRQILLTAVDFRYRRSHR